MAGSKVSTYGPSDTDPTALMACVDSQRRGYHAVTITNFDNTSIPAIRAGSMIEVSGALFKFDAEETIGGSPSNGEVFIKLIPSVNNITAEFTNTAPTWNDAKQGWYGTSGSATHRYIHFGMIKSIGFYAEKYGFLIRDDRVLKYYADGRAEVKNFIVSANLEVAGTGTFTGKITPTGGIDAVNAVIKTKVINTGGWDMDANSNCLVEHGLTWDKILLVSGWIRNDSETAHYIVIGGGGSLGSPSLEVEVQAIGTIYIYLNRKTGGLFDGTDFTSTAFSRGKLLIWYEV